MLPNFIVIGAAKCGTTSMCDILGSHPQVFMSDPKEPHFFGRNDPQKTLQWYESFFAEANNEIAIGEGSTSYTHPDIILQSAKEIAELIPDCRLIYMVRHPLKRLESDWKMRKHEGWAEGSINESVEKQATLITHGLYWQNISVYRNFFADDQILIVFLEDFTQNPERELKRCFQHIGVNQAAPLEDIDKPRNKSNNFRKDGIIARYLRQTEIIHSVKKRMPTWMISGAKKVLTRRQDLTIRWDEKIKNTVIGKLKDDSRNFLKHCDKLEDFWHFGDQM